MHKAFALNETSAIIYNACNGKTTFDELKVKYKFTDDLIFLALDELKRENLIEDYDSFKSPLAGMSRREAVVKVALGSIVALPIISSLIAPTAAQATSGTCTNQGTSCRCTVPNGTDPATCVSGDCTGGGGCVCNVIACDGGINCLGQCS